MRYVLDTAEPMMCVPAVIRMIMASEGCAAPDQLRIARDLGLLVSPSMSERYPGTPTSEKPEAWGVHVYPGALASFFGRNGCPLCESYLPISTMHDWEYHDAIQRALEIGAHVVTGVDVRVLFGKGEPGEGHVLLVLDAADYRSVSVLDPGPLDSGRKSVPLELLYDACVAKQDGLWLISRHAMGVSNPE
jgi:hypothetical protein